MGIDRRMFIGVLIVGAVQATGRPEDARALEDRLCALANRERRSRKLAALSWNEALAAEARRHSERMARYRFFDHSDPERGSLGDRLSAAGIGFQACAENLFRRPKSPDQASAAVQAWLGSRGHRSNLLNPVYRETGVGVALDSVGSSTITQIFLA